MSFELEHLTAEREQLYRELSQIGDFRRGSIYPNYRRCGKTNCACTQPDHPGHGPQYLLTTKVDGKSHARSLKKGIELDTVRQEVANHQKFKDLITNIVAINAQICDIKETELQADTEATAKKGASKTSSKRKSSPI
ncbi:MAG TPA: DUF6788 family protein [Candidatus Limnocylindrales bacterium]|nr:DUF6788 family protein [Candidatus Limnocylindrales bacterium]